MPIVTAISTEGLIILGTWPIPFLLGGLIGWVLRGCLRHKDSEPESTTTSRNVRERVPETEDSEPGDARETGRGPGAADCDGEEGSGEQLVPRPAQGGEVRGGEGGEDVGSVRD